MVPEASAVIIINTLYINVENSEEAESIVTNMGDSVVEGSVPVLLSVK